MQESEKIVIQKKTDKSQILNEIRKIDKMFFLSIIIFILPFAVLYIIITIYFMLDLGLTILFFSIELGYGIYFFILIILVFLFCSRTRMLNKKNLLNPFKYKLIISNMSLKILSYPGFSEAVSKRIINNIKFSDIDKITLYSETNERFEVASKNNSPISWIEQRIHLFKKRELDLKPLFFERLYCGNISIDNIYVINLKKEQEFTFWEPTKDFMYTTNRVSGKTKKVYIEIPEINKFMNYVPVKIIMK